MLILQAIIGVLFTVLSIEMTFRPPKNKRQTKNYRIGFLVLGFATIGVAIWQWLADQKKDKETERSFADLKTAHQVDMNVAQTNIFRLIQSNQFLQDRYILAMATNVALPIETRQALFNAQRTAREVSDDDMLSTLATLDSRLEIRRISKELDSERTKKKAQEEIEARLKERAEIYNGYVRGIETKLSRIAALNGDKLISDFDGMPLALTINPTNVANFTFKTNSLWDFKLVYFWSAGHFYLTMSCRGGSMEIFNSQYIVMRISDMSVYNIPIGDDAKGVEQAFWDLIASHREQVKKVEGKQP